MRIGRPVHQGLSGPDIVAFMNTDVFSPRDHIFFRLSDIRPDDHFPLPFDILSEFHDSINIADQGVLLRLPGFEEFRHPGKTSSNVFRLRRLPGNLNDDISRLHHIAFGDEDVGPHGKEIPGLGGRTRKIHGPSLLVLD